jgi:hypothetical protein
MQTTSRVPERAPRIRRMTAGTFHCCPTSPYPVSDQAMNEEEVQVPHTTLSPTQASARLTSRLSCAHRRAAVTSLRARSVRFCWSWIWTIRATASTAKSRLVSTAPSFGEKNGPLTAPLMLRQQRQGLLRLSSGLENRAADNLNGYVVTRRRSQLFDLLGR